MLRSALLRFLDDEKIRDGRLLVGVSGGADSVALLRGLVELAKPRCLELIVGHFDHALREDSAEDAQWVKSLSDQLHFSCRIERRIPDAGNSAGRESESSARPITENRHASVHVITRDPTLPEEVVRREEVARQLRYDFLIRTAQELECRWLAVAHTADDQAETILHHIVRGSGLKGISGIPSTRQLNASLKLIRPLLEVRRVELTDYLKILNQSFRTDSTNESRDYTRNRIRHDLLPKLRSEFNPRVDEALLRLSQQACEMQIVFEELADELLQTVILEQTPDNVRLRGELLATRPPALLREVFSRLWQSQNWPRQALSFSHLQRLAEMITRGTPGKLSLPGKIEAACRGNLFELRRNAMRG